jgi:crossover junction endodeoxyribonuclease RuvC
MRARRSRVLGIDPGSRTTGWGVVDGDTREASVVEFGCLHPPRGGCRADALAKLSDALAELLGRFAPDVVAIETPFTGRFPASALALAEARGALLVALGRWGGTVVEYEPARVKAAIVGHGRAEKRQVVFIVQRLLALPSPPAEDAADALALALCHMRSVLP